MSLYSTISMAKQVSIKALSCFTSHVWIRGPRKVHFDAQFQSQLMHNQHSFKEFKMNMFQVMPLNQLIFHLTNITNIYCNLSLFKYLDTESKKNIGGHHKMRIKNALLNPSTSKKILSSYFQVNCK